MEGLDETYNTYGHQTLLTPIATPKHGRQIFVYYVVLEGWVEIFTLFYFQLGAFFGQKAHHSHGWEAPPHHGWEQHPQKEIHLHIHNGQPGVPGHEEHAAYCNFT